MLLLDPIFIMSKAFIAAVLQDSLGCGFTLPSFGSFQVSKTRAGKALNPRTGEPVKVKAGKTARFKASPNLKKAI